MFRWDILNLYLKHCSKNSWLQLYLQFTDMRAGDVSSFCASHADSCYCTWQSSFPRGNHQTACSSLGILRSILNSLTAMGTHYIRKPGMQMHDYIYYKHQFPSHYSTECSLSCAQHCHTSLRFFVDVLLHILHPRSKMSSVDPKFDGLGT